MNPRYTSHRAPNPPLEDNAFREVTPDLLKDDEARAEVMQKIRDALYEYGDLAKLAENVGRSERCLYMIRGGYTRWPRWETLFALLTPLGLRLTVVHISERFH